VRSQDDDGKSPAPACGFRQTGQAVHSAHLEVRNDELGARGASTASAFSPLSAPLTLWPAAVSRRENEFQNIRVVVDEEEWCSSWPRLFAFYDIALDRLQCLGCSLS